MSSHQNSAYNNESYFQLPGRVVGPARPKDPRALRPAANRAPRIGRPPEQIWGQYNNYRANGVAVSAIIHIAVIGLLLSGIFVSHQITERKERQVVTLIAPSPESYALPVAKKVISGGGGGGDRDPFLLRRVSLPKLRWSHRLLRLPSLCETRHRSLRRSRP